MERSLRNCDHSAKLAREARCAGRRVGDIRQDFRTFREAVHYFLTVLSHEERDVHLIVTADGREWRRADLLALYKPKSRDKLRKGRIL